MKSQVKSRYGQFLPDDFHYYGELAIVSTDVTQVAAMKRRAFRNDFETKKKTCMNLLDKFIDNHKREYFPDYEKNKVKHFTENKDMERLNMCSKEESTREELNSKYRSCLGGPYVLFYIYGWKHGTFDWKHIPFTMGRSFFYTTELT